jgi:hypothetical protein
MTNGNRFLDSRVQFRQCSVLVRADTKVGSRRALGMEIALTSVQGAIRRDWPTPWDHGIPTLGSSFPNNPLHSQDPVMAPIKSTKKTAAAKEPKATAKEPKTAPKESESSGLGLAGGAAAGAATGALLGPMGAAVGALIGGVAGVQVEKQGLSETATKVKSVASATAAKVGEATKAVKTVAKKAKAAVIPAPTKKAKAKPATAKAATAKPAAAKAAAKKTTPPTKAPAKKPKK